MLSYDLRISGYCTLCRERPISLRRYSNEVSSCSIHGKNRRGATARMSSNGWNLGESTQRVDRGWYRRSRRRRNILLGDLPRHNHTMRTVHLYSKRNGCKKLWSNLRNRSELYCKQQPRPAKEHTCCRIELCRHRESKLLFQVINIVNHDF